MDTEPKKILILHASAGDGHRKAAEVMGHAARRLYPSANVEVLDALDFTPAWFKRFYVGLYIFLIHSWPGVWGLSYEFSDNPILGAATPLLRRAMNGLMCRALERKILSSGADVVYSTHFMVSEVCAHLKRRGLRSKTVTVITDFLVHRFWVFHETDAYSVAVERTKKVLVKFGIPEERIRVTGIPIDPKFGQAADRAALASKLGLDAKRFTALVTSGGSGAGPMQRVVDIILNEPDTQVLMVCGRNRELESQMRELAKTKPSLKPFGFVSNMDELMDCSDAIIGKAGGITLSESLAKRKPFFILSPVPGQETRNAIVLTDCGAAVWIRDLFQLSLEIRALRAGGQARMLAAIDEARRPKSAEEAVSTGKA